MNYIAYKQIDGTITSGFKVKLYDIVTVNNGNNLFPEIRDDICRIFERTYFFDCFVVEIFGYIVFFDVIQVFQILDTFA